MSTKFKPVKSDKAPPAIGPYSCALDANGTIYLSGQLPIDENGSMPDTLIEQAARCLLNIKHLLEDAGLHMDNVVKTTVFITNMDDFDTVNSVYKRYFIPPYPARCCVEVSRLPKGAKVLIDCIAVR